MPQPRGGWEHHQSPHAGNHPNILKISFSNNKVLACWFSGIIPASGSPSSSIEEDRCRRSRVRSPDKPHFFFLFLHNFSIVS